MQRSVKFSLAVLVFVSVATLNSKAQSFMTHHMRAVTRNGEARFAGQLPQDRIMSLNIVLPLRDEAGLKKLLSDLYNPSSPSYRHFLTVPEFTARFGPSQQDYDAVVL